MRRKSESRGMGGTLVVGVVGGVVEYLVRAKNTPILDRER